MQSSMFGNLLKIKNYRQKKILHYRNKKLQSDVCFEQEKIPSAYKT